MTAASNGLGLSALLAVLLAADGESQQIPDWASSFGYDPAELHPISIELYGYPFVQVRVEGEELELPFDTGNMVGLQLAPAIIERLGLRRVGQWTSRNSDGSLVGEYGIYEAREVAILGDEPESERVYELAHPSLPGLVGPQFLRGKRFTIDYASQLLAITDRPSPEGMPAMIQLVPSDRHPDLLLVYGEVHGRQVLMQIDTGKSRSTIDPELARSLGLEANANGVAIEDLRFGPSTFAVPSAKLVNQRQIDPGLSDPILVGIGSDLLRHIILTVDRPAGRVGIVRR